jgi:hypothetical protein
MNAILRDATVWVSLAVLVISVIGGSMPSAVAGTVTVGT